jgi:hypothetical protein
VDAKTVDAKTVDVTADSFHAPREPTERTAIHSDRN